MEPGGATPVNVPRIDIASRPPDPPSLTRTLMPSVVGRGPLPPADLHEWHAFARLMPDERGGRTVADLVARRADLLSLLGEPHAKPEMVESLDTSRSTVDRAIRRLRDAGLVEQRRGGYALTYAGRVAVEQHRSYRESLAATAAAEPVVAPLSPDTDLDVAMLRGATSQRSAEPSPYRALEPLHEAIGEADRYRGALPALDDPRHFRLLYEHVVSGGRPAALTVSRSLLDALREEFPRRLEVLLNRPEMELTTGPVPAYGLVVTERDGEETTTGIIYDDGTVHGTLRNDAEPAADWARERLATVAERATTVMPAEDRPADEGPSLDPVLEREGFVRPSESYFATRPTADPVDAWLAGPGLPEVQAGYAVDPTLERDGERTGMTDHLLSRVREGPVAVVGPPGSGKSTVCKRVACEWHRDGGTVFYREGGHQPGFDAVRALTAAVRDADDPLVVVEDCLAPDARSVFEVVASLDDGEAAVLLDSRASDWSDPPTDLPVEPPEAAEAIRMPSLLDGDAERLAERFERLVDAAVDVSAEQLRTAVRDERRPGDGAAPAEPLLLAHRLASRLEGRTTPSGLESAVEAVRTDLEERGDAAVAVGLIVNLLNAAGVPVHAAYVHAAVEADSDAVRSGLDALDGRVLFGRDTDRFRTVHDSWSTVYLRSALADGGADTLGRCCTRLLALGDTPDARAAAREAVTGDGTGAAAVLDRIAAAPGEWADDTTERLFGLGPDLPALAPALAGTDGQGELPAACSDATRGRVQGQRAESWMLAGDPDAAEDAYEQLREGAEAGRFGDASDRLVWRAIHGLGDVARRCGEFDRAEELMETAAERARAAGNERQAAVARMHLGVLAEYRGDLDRAERLLTGSLDDFADAGGPGDRADALDNLGIVYRKLGRYDDAAAAHRECLDIRRSLGDLAGEQRAVHNLGTLARHRGDLTTAERRFRRSLDLQTECGGPAAEAYVVGALGRVYLRRGHYDRAREALDRGLELARETGDRHVEMEFEIDHGLLAHRTGDAATAGERLERAVDLAREVEDRRGESDALRASGVVALESGDLDSAAERLSEARSLAAETGYRDGEANCWLELARLARRRDDGDVARRRLDEVFDITEAADNRLVRARAEAVQGAVTGDPDTIADAADRLRDAGAVPAALWATDLLVDACEAAGALDTAAGHCDRAVDLAREAGLTEDRERFAERRRSFETDPDPTTASSDTEHGTTPD